MKQRLLILVSGLLYYSGLIWVVRWGTQRAETRLIILNYHRASCGDLRSHLRYLRRAYRILALDQALEELHRGSPRETHNRDRRTLLAVTFDDGYRDNYTHAAMLARELEVPITIFLIPSYSDTRGRFWWYEGEYLAGATHADRVTLANRTYDLHETKQRAELARDIYARVCHARSVTERERFLASARTALGVPAAAPDSSLFGPLSWTEVQQMRENAWISFGAHTVHHPVLAYLDDPDEVRREVSECRSTLESRLGRPVQTFAYPLGKLEHIGEHALRAVREAGYTWSVTTERGINTAQTDPHLLHRIVLDDANKHWLIMAADVAGVLPFLVHIRHKLLRRREPASPAQLAYDPGAASLFAVNEGVVSERG